MWKEKKKRGERGTYVKREKRAWKKKSVYCKSRKSTERDKQAWKENHVLPDADKAAAWKWRGSWQKTWR